MTRFPILIAFLALAACGEANPPGSPADADIRKAILRFYAKPGGPLSQFDPNYMKYHQIVSTGRCQAMDSDFVCPVTFERTGEGQVKRFVWMTKETEGWTAVGVTAEIPPA
jgi:hypothetical protein